MPNPTTLPASARRLARLLKKENLKIVFAESCTGGLISAALTRIPGISNYHCGSAVVYQLETKSEWLGVSPKLLKHPGPVSEKVARAMAEGVLAKTPHADVSASVTGYLGPDSPSGQDGLLFCAVAWRGARNASTRFQTTVVKHRLVATRAEGAADKTRLRIQRQAAAAVFVISRIVDCLGER
jgi:PncC family amidohydrolase